MNQSSGILISELKSHDIEEVSWLLANSMSSNPINRAVFKSSDKSVLPRQQKMFEMVLKDKNNITFIARLDDRIVGTMTYTSSRNCQLGMMEIIKLLPKLTVIFGPFLINVLRWRKNWAKHDCREAHIHFGPLAVDVNYQGKGVGKSLLDAFCQELDVSHKIGFLETDRLVNVGLYEKFGFRVVKTDKLFGVRNWFMLRDPENK